MANNIIKSAILILLGILLGRESLRYERDTLTELMKAIKEQPVQINIQPLIPIPIPIPMQPRSTPSTSDPSKWKITQCQNGLTSDDWSGNEPYLQSAH
jgi:hypothetical protein